MSEHNRVCKTCQTVYKYCPNCYKDRYLPTWMVMFHEENCKNIFKILCDDYYKHISREKSIELLSHCNLENLESFEEDIKRQITDILSEERSETEKKSAKEEIAENNIDLIKKPTGKRRRKK